MPRNKKDLKRGQVGITILLGVAVHAGIYTSLPELMHTQDREVRDMLGRLLCKLEREYFPLQHLIRSQCYVGWLHFNIQWFSDWTNVCSRAPTCSMTSSCECSVSKSLIRSCRTCACNSWWHVLI